MSAPPARSNGALRVPLRRSARDAAVAVDDEHPQTVALVLSHLPDQVVADLIGQMSPPQQTAAIERIATMTEPGPEIV